MPPRIHSDVENPASKQVEFQPEELRSPNSTVNRHSSLRIPGQLDHVRERCVASDIPSKNSSAPQQHLPVLPEGNINLSTVRQSGIQTTNMSIVDSSHLTADDATGPAEGATFG